MSFASEAREAIVAALPVDTSLHGRSPEPRHVYVSPSHIKALRLENALVIGGRGVGKSFWSAALSDPSIRGMIGAAVPDLSNIEVSSGFGETPDIRHYPDPDTFSSLLSSGHDAYRVWRAVVGRWAARIVKGDIPPETWEQTTSWVKSDPEALAVLLENANRKLASDNRNGLIIFDALDRASHDWPTMDKMCMDSCASSLRLRHSNGYTPRFFFARINSTGVW